MEQVMERITHMEQCFDILREADPAAIQGDAALTELLRQLTEYYQGGLWLQDYELDEKGLLPQELKRGVLSQDAVYDLLERLRDTDK